MNPAGGKPRSPYRDLDPVSKVVFWVMGAVLLAGAVVACGGIAFVAAILWQLSFGAVT